MSPFTCSSRRQLRRGQIDERSSRRSAARHVRLIGSDLAPRRQGTAPILHASHAWRRLHANALSAPHSPWSQRPVLPLADQPGDSTRLAAGLPSGIMRLHRPGWASHHYRFHQGLPGPGRTPGTCPTGLAVPLQGHVRLRLCMVITSGARTTPGWRWWADASTGSSPPISALRCFWRSVSNTEEAHASFASPEDGYYDITLTRPAPAIPRGSPCGCQHVPLRSGSLARPPRTEKFPSQAQTARPGGNASVLRDEISRRRRASLARRAINALGPRTAR